MALTEDFRQHRERFFAAIFFVAGEQHDVFALRGHAGSGFEDKRRGRGGVREGEGRDKKNDGAKQATEIHKRVKF